MSTVVYLANQQIQVVTGTPGQKKISVSNCYVANAPDGSIINGMIMDTELFVGFMKDFWSSNSLPDKDVILVVNSTKFVGKNIELPVLNEKKTFEFIEREFTDIRRDDEYIYGYIPIGLDNKIRKIYAESTTPEYISDYINIFHEIGIKIRAIYSGESSLIGLTAMTAGQRYKTFVMQIADKMMITTLLWVNGSFYYFNSTRCFHEQGTEDYANDIARSVSQIIQFMQAHQIEYPLEAVLLAGINPIDIHMYQSFIMQQGIQAPVILFEDNNIIASNMDVQNFLHAASGLVVNGKWRNFLDRYNSGKKKTKNEGEGRKGLYIIFAALAVMLILLASTSTYRAIRKKALKEVEAYNESPEVLLDVALYDALTSRNAFLAAQYAAIADLNDNLYTYPVCDDGIMDIVMKCAGSYAEIDFESFDADQGMITMSAVADTVDNINKFISELNAQEIFSDINYTGYTYQEQTDKWDIHVTCTLAESAGR